MTIQGKKVNFRDERVKAEYRLPNANMGQFHVKGWDPGSWMVDILCLGKTVPWAIIKIDIPVNDFKAAGRIWLNIIYSRVFPCTQLTIVTDAQAYVMACIMSYIALNVGDIMSLEWL